MDVARKLKRRERELDELGKLISDIAKFAEELHKSVNEDMGNVLKNEEANKELKEFLVIILILYFQETIKLDLSAIKTNLVDVSGRRENIINDLAKALKKAKPKLPIDDHLNLLRENISIKKRTRELLKELNDINSKFRDIKKRY